jgi:hypothetical protein
MKYNLICGGIEQTALDYEEETEAVLKEFIKTELEIPDADQINFQNSRFYQTFHQFFGQVLRVFHKLQHQCVPIFG